MKPCIILGIILTLAILNLYWLHSAIIFSIMLILYLWLLWEAREKDTTFRSLNWLKFWR